MISEFTLESIILDLLDNLENNELKRNKILDRLLTIVSEIDISGLECKAELELSLQKFKHKPVIFDMGALFDYLKTTTIRNKPGDIILLNNNNKYETQKKYLERILTDIFVENIETYSKTCDIFLSLIKHLANEIKMDDNVIIRFKGSMAMRKVLERLTTSNITGAFSNSDNDASITVNPEMENYEEFFNKISDILFARMNQLADYYYSLLEEEVKKIEKRLLSIGNFWFKAKNKKTCSFDYIRATRDAPYRKLQFTENRRIRIQRNFICLPAESFELLRIKIPFRIGRKTICCEVLDISLPFKNSRTAVKEFKNKKYFSKN